MGHEVGSRCGWKACRNVCECVCVYIRGIYRGNWYDFDLHAGQRRQEMKSVCGNARGREGRIGGHMSLLGMQTVPQFHPSTLLPDVCARTDGSCVHLGEMTLSLQNGDFPEFLPFREYFDKFLTMHLFLSNITNQSQNISRRHLPKPWVYFKQHFKCRNVCVCFFFF